MALCRTDLANEDDLNIGVLKPFDTGVPTLCELCQIEFNLISIHKKIFHSGNTEYKCAFCGMPFTSRKRLLDHLDDHNNGTDLFCCLCLVEQKSDDALSEHLETHEELHVFLCIECRMTFASKSGLSGHDCLPQVLEIKDEHDRISVPENGDGSGPSTCQNSTLLNIQHHFRKNRNSTTVVESESTMVVKKDRPLMNIEKRQLRFSENLAPQVSSSETTTDRLRSSTRNGHVHLMSEVADVKAGMELDHNPVSVEAGQGTVSSSTGTPLSARIKVEVPETTNDSSKLILFDTSPDDASTDETVASLKIETPSMCLLDPGVDSNLAQCPSTAVNVDAKKPRLFDAELPQPAALPPELATGKEAPEGSHTNPRIPADENSSEQTPKLQNSRPTRKRPHAATVDVMVKGKDVSSEVQTCINDLGGSTETTPFDSPAPAKKTRISFNEQIEFWNPILRERAWLGITEESPKVREVPLLKISPSRKDKKKSKNKKKSSKSTKRTKKTGRKSQKGTPKSDSPFGSPASLSSTTNTEATSSIGLCTPPPLILRPVLKPSPSPLVATPVEELNVKGRCGRMPANSQELFQKFGPKFMYKSCLKVDGRYHCPDNDCRNNNDKGFATDKGLRLHIRQHHIQAPVYECNRCAKSFVALSKLKDHMEVHNAPDTYSCPVCEKKFRTLQSSKQHQLLHEMPFQCHHCKLKFARKESLRVHLRTTKCTCCHVILRCAELFRRHEIEVPHFYKCTVCKKKLRTLQRFNWHVRVVHYDKSTLIDGKWICQVCDRKFVDRHSAIRHARINHKPFIRDTVPKNG